MPTLNWIGKDKVVNHHMDVPYKILEHQYGYADGKQSKDETNSGNKIIHGDNLEALKALLPEYEGRIDCIYIDPPYNTGNEGWMYNDNVNDPKIKKWLSRVVGKEGEDLSRHDKWLCMMYPRLKLLHKLLSRDGAIFISIDDNEHANLKLICDEVFGGGNFVDTIIWQKVYTLKNSAKYFSGMHEYLTVYAKNKPNWKINLLNRTDKSDETYSNPDNDSRGLWTTNAIQARNPYDAGHYPILSPSGRTFLPPKGTSWRISEDNFHELNNDGRIWWGQGGESIPRIKKFLSEAKDGIVPSTLWFHQEAGQNAEAKSTLREIFEDLDEELFNTPKPEKLINRILQLSTNKSAVVLDSFSGSGTTAHAVLNLNKRDGGNRKFILVEMEDYAESITSERVKRIIKGYSYVGTMKETVESFPISLTTIKGSEKIIDRYNELLESKEYDKVKIESVSPGKIDIVCSKKINGSTPGLGGGFDFYTLGQPLFLEEDVINEEVGLDKIREYVWFSETRQPYNEVNTKEEHLLGTANSTAYYFYYFKDQLTTLDDSFLRKLKTKAEQYTIYADNCVLDAELMQKYHITFKKIPRDITRF